MSDGSEQMSTTNGMKRYTNGGFNQTEKPKSPTSGYFPVELKPFLGTLSNIS